MSFSRTRTRKLFYERSDVRIYPLAPLWVHIEHDVRHEVSGTVWHEHRHSHRHVHVLRMSRGALSAARRLLPRGRREIIDV